MCKNEKIVVIMPRQKNDGRGRLGGRAKGTKNKPKVYPTVGGKLLETATGYLDNNSICDEKSEGLIIAAAIVEGARIIADVIADAISSTVESAL